jgi:hypothetical protein
MWWYTVSYGEYLLIIYGMVPCLMASIYWYLWDCMPCLIASIFLYFMGWYTVLWRVFSDILWGWYTVSYDEYLLIFYGMVPCILWRVFTDFYGMVHYVLGRVVSDVSKITSTFETSGTANSTPDHYITKPKTSFWVQFQFIPGARTRCGGGDTTIHLTPSPKKVGRLYLVI